MSTQIFKYIYTKESLFNFFDKFAEKYNNYYKIDKIAFKRAEYQNLLIPFFEELKNHYYQSKQFYLTRKITYNNFLTIIRQICKINKLPFQKNISYIKSTYDITYFIYIE